jgi:MFS family permease
LTYYWDKLKNRFFYGYIIISVLFVIQLLMFGPRGSYGVFFKPFTDDFGWSRALIAGAFSLSSLVQGASSIFMGGLTDRFGPRLVLSLCGFLMGTGLVLMHFVDSVWQLYLFYVVIFGTGMGGIYAPQVSTIARWFVKRRNLMTGLLMAGGGLGGFVAPPVITWLVYTYSWRDAFLYVGIFVFVLVVFFSQFLKRDPSKTGQISYGEENRKKNETHSSGLSLKQALRTGRFWLFALAVFSFGFSLVVVMVHIVPFAIDRGISPASAATVLACMHGGMAVGSIGIGLIADKIGSRRVLIVCFCLLTVVALFLLPVIPAWLMAIFVIILSVGGGGIAVIESTMVDELFGMKSHGVILGAIVFIYTIGAASGPVLAGSIFDYTRSYQWAFILCAALNIGAIIMIVFLNRIRKQMAEGRLRI